MLLFRRLKDWIRIEEDNESGGGTSMRSIT